MDNIGTFSFSGCVAGDEETYDVFREFFEKIIFEQHGHAPGKLHPVDVDASKLHGGDFDSQYVVAVRLRVIRNLRGFCLPPFCTRGERRDIESVLTKALFSMDNNYKGTYYSLQELSSEEQIALKKVKFLIK